MADFGVVQITFSCDGVSKEYITISRRILLATTAISSSMDLCSSRFTWCLLNICWSLSLAWNALQHGHLLRRLHNIYFYCMELRTDILGLWILRITLHQIFNFYTGYIYILQISLHQILISTPDLIYWNDIPDYENIWLRDFLRINFHGLWSSTTAAWDVGVRFSTRWLCCGLSSMLKLAMDSICDI